MNSCLGPGKPRAKAPKRRSPPEGRAGRSGRGQRLGDFLRFAGVGVNLVADDAQGHFVQLALEGPIEFVELRPQNQIDEAFGDADHHGRAALPMETDGLSP